MTAILGMAAILFVSFAKAIHTSLLANLSYCALCKMPTVVTCAGPSHLYGELLCSLAASKLRLAVGCA